MLETLPPRERQLFDLIYRNGELNAAELQELLPDPPTNSAIRAMLTRMEQKGIITHREEGQRYVYRTALPEPKVRQSALSSLISTFFGGSPASAATALLGMSERLTPEELDRFEALIAKARKEQKK